MNSLSKKIVKNFGANTIYMVLITGFQIISVPIFIKFWGVIAGKSIVIFLFVLLWFLYHKSKLIFISTLVTSFVLFTSISDLLLSLQYFFEGTVTASRLSQIQLLVDSLDFREVAKTKTSLGNIIAETYTVLEYLKGNLISLILGFGFGGGVTDIYGYYGQFAGKGGYAAIDQFRNNYFRMHLPFTEILLKMGLVGIFIYIKFLKKYISDFNIKSITVFIPKLICILRIKRDATSNNSFYLPSKQ